MGKSQRTKGHSYERRVARLLRKVIGGQYFRVDETRQGKGVDVIAENPSTDLWDSLIVQCKAREKLSVVPSFLEAWKSPLNGPSKIPVLWHHRNNGPHLVTMDEIDFLALFVLAGSTPVDEYDDVVEHVIATKSAVAV